MKTKEYTRINEIAPLKYDGGRLLILDQTLLPGREEFLEAKNAQDVWEAIKSLRVRGAPAIGVAAAYGICIALRGFRTSDPGEFRDEFRRIKGYLASSRPTAVNLFWALDRMERKLDSLLANGGVGGAGGGGGASGVITGGVGGGGGGAGVFDIGAVNSGLLGEAEAIRLEDEAACAAMGRYGLSLLKPQMGILTHCNAGAIATSRLGTALAPIHLGQREGYNFRVFVDETRPLLQGSRLTAWELMKSGVDVKLICDNMAAFVFKNGWIDAVVVGCDRMALNGDGANKIGTLGAAVLAKEFGVPFYMFVPTSTIDPQAESGNDIPIEFRDEGEISEMWYVERMAPEGVGALNPAFDVTDHKYISAIVTEKGIVTPPFGPKLRELCGLPTPTH